VDCTSSATNQIILQVAMREMQAINQALALACNDELDTAMAVLNAYLEKNG